MTFAFTVLAVASLLAVVCVLAAARDEDSLEPFDEYARSAIDNPLFAVTGDRERDGRAATGTLSDGESTWR